MKTNSSLSSILRQLKPPSRLPNPGLSQLRHNSPVAASHQSQRTVTCALQRRLDLSHTQSRSQSTQTTTPPSSVPTAPAEPLDEPQEEPKYEVTFTCKPCLHRSTHRFTKRSYHRGTVIITCPSCKNRHVFADHLKIFADKGFTIEDLLRAKGEQFKRGTLGDDMEFWEDGTQSERVKAQ